MDPAGNLDEPRSAGPLLRAYDFREEGGMWTVYDCQSGCAAVINGVPQIGLGLNEADDLAAILNRVESQRIASRIANDAWEWTGSQTRDECRRSEKNGPEGLQRRRWAPRAQERGLLNLIRPD